MAIETDLNYLFYDLMVSRPDVFLDQFVYIPTEDGRSVHPKGNVGITASLEYFLRGHSHILYNPRQTGASSLLATLHCWLNLFLPEVEVSFLGVGLRDLQWHENRVHYIYTHLHEDIRVTFPANTDTLISQPPWPMHIKHVYLVNNFEFLRQEDIFSLFEMMRKPEYLVVGNSVRNRFIDKVTAKVIDDTLEYTTNLETYGKLDTLKLPAILYPEFLFFTEEQLENFRRTFGPDQAAYRAEIERARI